MFPCKNCPEKYIGQTSKKIQTRLREHQNAMQTTTDINLTGLERNALKATTKHAREFKERGIVYG